MATGASAIKVPSTGDAADCDSVSLFPRIHKDYGRREGSVERDTGEMAWALGVDGGPDGQSPHRPPEGPMRETTGREDTQQGLSRPGWREIAGTLGQLQAGRQAGNGMACSRAKARLTWVSQGQAGAEIEAARRAGDPSQTRAKTRRLRVLVITVRSPRPIRAVQRSRLCAITWTASQAPLAASAPTACGSPTPYLRSRMAFSTSAGGDDRPPVPASPQRGR